MIIRRRFDIPAALQSLTPGATWALRGDEWSGLEWRDENIECPTEEAVAAEITRLQEEYDSLEYQRLRKEAYPSIEDQLDTLYHDGLDAWRASVKAVKDEFPKP